MLNKFTIRLTNRPVLPSYGSILSNWRKFSTVSSHSRLPATVYRLQLLPESNLLSMERIRTGRPKITFLCQVMAWCTLECPKKSQVCIDDTVCSRTNSSPAFNGPLFMPNTILMQELARNAFDQYCEEDEAIRPVLISIKKGTVRSLLLADDTNMVLQGRFFPHLSLPSIKTLHYFHSNRRVR